MDGRTTTESPSFDRLVYTLVRSAKEIVDMSDIRIPLANSNNIHMTNRNILSNNGTKFSIAALPTALL